VLGAVEMGPGVLVFRGVAAADVPARQTQPEMHPAVADLQAGLRQQLEELFLGPHVDRLRDQFAFTIVPNSFGAVLQYADRDRSGNIAMGFPAYYLIDQNGIVRMKSSGWDKVQDVDAQISRLLAGPREMVAAAAGQK